MFCTSFLSVRASASLDRDCTFDLDESGNVEFSLIVGLDSVCAGVSIPRDIFWDSE